MHNIKLYIITISALFLFLSCENYIESEQINEVIKQNDLSVKFKILSNDEHNYTFKKIDSSLVVNVEDNFSVTSGAVSIQPNKNYKLIVELKNESADPLILLSFWKSVVNQSRQHTFCGKDGNPPTSKTQEKSEQWIKYEENFSTKLDEKFIVFRIYSNKGKFLIKNIYIKEQFKNGENYE